MDETTITSVLVVCNRILSSAGLIIGFSLLVYILTHNFRNSVAQAFCALLTFVIIVYSGDVIIANVGSLDQAAPWLRLQWLGIAFVPAAYLHFSDSLLRTTNAISRVRRALVWTAYLVSAVCFILVTSTNLIVREGMVLAPRVYQFSAGPLFLVFAIYFFAATLISVVNTWSARQRCLTSTSRRRMTYLTLSVIAPAAGVFPYMLISTMSMYLSTNWVLALTLLGNAGILFMTTVVGYSVAYQGVLLPDRVVKHSLITYLLRGPLVGIGVIALMLTVPHVEVILGLSRDTVLIFAVAMGIVLFQVAVDLAKPYIGRLAYSKDRDEVNWIEELDRRLLTTTDLEQLLENVLIALCDLLRVRSGFIVTMEHQELKLRVFCGPRKPAHEFISGSDLIELMDSMPSGRGEGALQIEFGVRDGYWLLPLRNGDGATIGILGIESWGVKADFSEEEHQAISSLISRAERALQDMRLQQEVFTTLQRLAPELEEFQRWRSTPRYAPARPVENIEGILLNMVDAPRIVKDALTHYWGGPKLSQSPLLRLRVVKDALKECDGVPSKALRSSLNKATERLRPSGERSLTASEWVIYNILELRFIQGQRIRDVASRMAMSESDFYRKQRIAIEEVTKTITNMEREAQGHET